MDLKIDPYTIGGVVAISAGGYLIIKAYNNYSAVSIWNTIGMVTIGSALVWTGVKIFSTKSTGEKKKETEMDEKEILEVNEIQQPLEKKLKKEIEKKKKKKKRKRSDSL